MRHFPLAQAFLDALAECDAKLDEFDAAAINVIEGITDRRPMNDAEAAYETSVYKLRQIEREIDAL